MTQSFEAKQKELKKEVQVLEREVKEQEQQSENLEQFIQRVKRNAELTELTPYAAHELIWKHRINPAANGRKPSTFLMIWWASSPSIPCKKKRRHDLPAMPPA